MNFKEAQAYLDSLQMHKIKLGLESMENFLAKVSRPDKRLKFVHVAGTNGKGSVSIIIVNILAVAGYKVGLFTSPHLSSVRERFRINNNFITEEEFALHASRVRKAMGGELITYFEFTTALALLWFAESNVDLVVLETGLGGRLDATNIVTPLVSVITNVSMDHEAYLGDDLRSVASEKAGIIKVNVPLVTAASNDESLDVISKRCQVVGSPMYLYGRDFSSTVEGEGTWLWKNNCRDLPKSEYKGLRCGMRGNYQIANSSLAIAVVVLLKKNGFQYLPANIIEGLATVHWPGRLEYITLSRPQRKNAGSGGVSKDCKLQYLIDGAHNPAGVASLVETLKNEYDYSKLIVVWGAMEDKDLTLTVPSIGDMASTIILTKPAGERAADPTKLLDVIPQHLQSVCHRIEDPIEALYFAEKVASEDDLIVVAGSLYLIGKVRSYLVGELVE